MAQAQDIIEFIEKVGNANVSVDQSKCIKVRNRNASCSHCLDICPAQVISYAENQLSFDAGKCLGCLACCTVCPTGALLPKRQTDTAVYAAAAAALTHIPGQVVFACEKIADAAKGLYDGRYVVSLKSLCSLDVSMLVYLGSQGVQDIHLVKGNCEECPMTSCPGVTNHVAETVNTLFETWNAPARVDISGKFPSNTKKTEDLGYDAERRGFFSDVRVEAKKAATDAGTVAMEKALGKEKQESVVSRLKVGGSGTLPILHNGRRTRLLAALDALGEPQDVMIETDLWGQVIIDLDKCRSCRICATFCPTGSLFKFHTKSGTIGVKQMVRDCVNCGCCSDVCLHKALTLDHEVFARDIADSAVERYAMDQPKAESKFTFNM